MKGKIILTTLLASLMTVFAGAATLSEGDDKSTEKTTVMEGNDYKIIKDEVVDSVRYITAIPSEIVCSNRIDIELVGDTIQSVVYTRGCNGNAKGIGALIKGMKVDEAIERLRGITCGKRPTSCPDQLARVLESVKKKGIEK